MIESLRWLLLSLTSLLFLVNFVHGTLYLDVEYRREPGEYLSPGRTALCFFAFFAASVFTLLASSLTMMWVAVELTTLVSAPLIACRRSRLSLEAMWKYLLICSIGIGLALFGTMIIMHAQQVGDARWYKTGFVFILAGYGTKTGLAPFHTWLPDAHSEAPAPVSALLSGALLNCSFFAIMRFRDIIPADAAPFCDGAMMSIALLGLAVAAVFMVRQTDYKRLLAYSSIEHMSIALLLAILAFRPGASRIATIALFAHLVFHSLTKTMLFLTAGNLLLAFRTRAIAAVQGLSGSMPTAAALWNGGLLLICGLPPSALFLTELALVFGMPLPAAAGTLVALFVVFAAMMHAGCTMTMGKTVHEPMPVPARLWVAPALLMALSAGAGAAGCIYWGIYNG